MTNYICINGKKAELTEEQMKALGIELPKASPFERAEKNRRYYKINSFGNVESIKEFDDYLDQQAFDAANYCTDKSIMEQRALHETLNRFLWRYSMEHDEDKIDWCPTTNVAYKIIYNHAKNAFQVDSNDAYQSFGAVYFYTHATATNAIEEIVKPFLAAHPDFKF